MILATYKFVSCELMSVHTRERGSSPGFDGVKIKFYYIIIILLVAVVMTLMAT